MIVLLRKGFKLLICDRLEGKVVLVNTHLDAGRSDLDRAARVAQLDQLVLVIGHVSIKR